MGFHKALDKDPTSSKKPWNKTESLPWAISPLRGTKKPHGNRQATSPIAEGQELIARVSDDKMLFRATKTQLNVESARKTVFKRKVKIQVKVLPMEKTGVFPAPHLPCSSGEAGAPVSKPADLCGILHCPEQPQLSRVILLPTCAFQLQNLFLIRNPL